MLRYSIILNSTNKMYVMSFVFGGVWVQLSSHLLSIKWPTTSVEFETPGSGGTFLLENILIDSYLYRLYDFGGMHGPFSCYRRKKTNSADKELCLLLICGLFSYIYSIQLSNVIKSQFLRKN